MDYKSLGDVTVYGVDGSTSLCEEGGGGWHTSTPQPLRRPLQQLNTASPRPQPSLTPYKYHVCKAIPEEAEDQENINPATRGNTDLHSSSKSCGISPEDTTHLTGSSSSPFAYPLIWESSHSAPAATPSTSSPTDTKKSFLPGDEISTWRSPISHSRGNRTLLSTPSSDGEGRKGAQRRREDQGEDKGSEKVRSRSGSSSEVSSNKSGCHRGLTVTPSKASNTRSFIDASVFLTPSGSMHCSRSAEARGGQTPKDRRPFATASTTHSINPFEVGAESLYLSAVSPSLFQQVVSPSQKVDGNFRWSIDQMASLHPANIETSPFMQVETLVDPEYERRAQDAIDKFFTTQQSVVPSPWTGSNKTVSLKKVAAQPQASPILPAPRTQSVWCQTELTLPPTLPEALEEALRSYCTFTQGQEQQGSGGDTDEATSLNNTTLRRKLLFSQEELLSATPMGSPRGGDVSEDCSEPSSPAQPFLSHHDPGSPIVEEEEDGGSLRWCMAVIEPGMAIRLKDGASLVRHCPLTPPLECGAPPSTTTTTTSPHYPGASHRVVISPLSHFKETRPSMSPDVSPIHVLHYSVDVESKPGSFTTITSPNTNQGNHHHTSHCDHPHTSHCSHSHTSHSDNSHTNHTVLSSPSEVLKATSQSRLHTPSPSGSVPHPRKPSSRGKWERSSSKHSNTTSPQEGHHQSPRLFSHSQESENPMRETSTYTVAEHDAVCSTVAKADMAKNQEVSEISLNMTEDFCIPSSLQNQTAVEPKPVRTGSPVAELRSSSNSGHFSSSPIRDVTHSPLEVDSPNIRFTASPPLSPILCRSIMFPSRTLAHSESAPLLKGRKYTRDITMMEESEGGIPFPSSGTLLRSSSLCDMETDSQPSMESNAGEEAPSQDTGYQTGSLLTTHTGSLHTPHTGSLHTPHTGSLHTTHTGINRTGNPPTTTNFISSTCTQDMLPLVPPQESGAPGKQMIAYTRNKDSNSEFSVN